MAKRQTDIEKAKLTVEHQNTKTIVEPKPYSFFTNLSNHNNYFSPLPNQTSIETSEDNDSIIFPSINRYQYCKKCRADIDSSYLILIQDNFKKETTLQRNYSYKINYNKNSSDVLSGSLELVPPHSEGTSEVFFGKKINLAVPIQKNVKPQVVVNKQNNITNNKTSKIILPITKSNINTNQTMLPKHITTPKLIRTLTEVGAFTKIQRD